VTEYYTYEQCLAFKNAGLDQTLNFGDWYYLDITGISKKAVLWLGEDDFLCRTYIRCPSAQEVLEWLSVGKKPSYIIRQVADLITFTPESITFPAAVYALFEKMKEK